MPFAIDKVFGVVNDVEHYAAFLPGCRTTKILSHCEKVYVAELDIAMRGVEERIVTRNSIAPPSRLEMSLIEGPFKYLSGIWSLVDLGEGCRVSLELDFEFKSNLLNLSSESLIKKGVEQVVSAFVAEVRARHGN